mmetsp:Transcript_29567/g.78227  ORF Transcript_29567/g.78227 Transcript_29567/m.78227 type:complete len:98 (-) Transcript_29567:1058-1351(-)
MMLWTELLGLQLVLMEGAAVDDHAGVAEARTPMTKWMIQLWQQRAWFVLTLSNSLGTIRAERLGESSFCRALPSYLSRSFSGDTQRRMPRETNMKTR